MVDVSAYDTIGFVGGNGGNDRGSYADMTGLDGGVEVTQGSGAVQGTVTAGETGLPVPSALIKVTGRSEYAVADGNGVYILALPAPGTCSPVVWIALAQMCQRTGLGDEPRKVFDEIAQIQMVDVVLPTRSGVNIRRRCVAQPTKHQAILLQRLGLTFATHLETHEM